MPSLVLAILYAATALARPPIPRPETLPLPEFAKELTAQEFTVPGLLKGAEARVDFASPEKPAVTDRALVYLHGFSASPAEAYPLAEKLARRWKANAYFARYSGHGIQGPDGMRGVGIQHWVDDTKVALVRARKLGKKVVVIATSTAASLVLPELIANPEGIEALVLQSPNFGLHARSSEVLLAPYPLAWLLGAVVLGPYRSFEPLNPRQALWWTYRYPFTAVLEMMRAMDLGRKASLEELRVPVLVLYSERDRVVSVEKMKEAFARIGSPRKQMLEVTKAENDHVLAGSILSPSGTSEVEELIDDFVGQ